MLREFLARGKGGGAGCLQGGAGAQGDQEFVGLGVEALVVDRILEAVNGEVDGGTTAADADGPAVAALGGGDRVADGGNFLVLDRTHEVVDGVTQFEERDVRLKGEAESIRRSPGDLFRGDDGPLRVVEGQNASPFDPGYVQSEIAFRVSQHGVSREERDKFGADVPEVPGMGTASFEVRYGEMVEFAFAKDGAEAAKILSECAEETPPILLIVNLESLEGSETVVGFDEAIGDRGGHRLHAVGARQWPEESCGNGALESGERTVGRSAAGMSRGATRRSCWHAGGSVWP